MKLALILAGCLAWSIGCMFGWAIPAWFLAVWTDSLFALTVGELWLVMTVALGAVSGTAAFILDAVVSDWAWWKQWLND